MQVLTEKRIQDLKAIIVLLESAEKIATSSYLCRSDIVKSIVAAKRELGHFLVDVELKKE